MQTDSQFYKFFAPKNARDWWASAFVITNVKDTKKVSAIFIKKTGKIADGVVCSFERFKYENLTPGNGPLFPIVELSLENALKRVNNDGVGKARQEIEKWINNEFPELNEENLKQCKKNCVVGFTLDIAAKTS